MSTCACLVVAAILLAAVPPPLFGPTRRERFLGYLSAMATAVAPAAFAPVLAASVEAALALTAGGALLGAALAISVSRTVLVRRPVPPR